MTSTDHPDAGRVIAMSEVDDRLRDIRSVIAALVVGVGSLVLFVGWIADVDSVTRLHSSLVSMKANTAIGFIVLGTLLAVEGRTRPVVTRTLATALVALGAATIVQYLLDVDLGIDELIVADPDDPLTPTPGRMGMNTAIGFFLLGLGRLANSLGTRAARTVERLLVTMVALLAYLALAGYIFRAASTRGLGSATEMALHTSVTFLLACAGLFTASSSEGLLGVLHSPHAGGVAARRILPPVLIAVVAAETSVQTLQTAGVLDSAELVLAYSSTVGVGVLVLTILFITNQLDVRDRQARDRDRELETIRSMFPDAHFRVDGDDADPSRTAPLGRTYPELDTASLIERVDAVAPRTASVTFEHGTGDDRRTLEARGRRFADGDVAVSVRDVSDLVQAREELEQLARTLEARVAERTEAFEAANTDLARSNEELERFAYVASHDLKEPLRMVSAFVQKLADGYGDRLDDRGHEYVHFAVEGAERMSDLIDSILRYSRAGRAELTRSRVPLGDVFEQVARSVGSRVASSGGTLDIDDDLPEVDGDAAVLGQIFLNLVQNALKFHEPGAAPHVVVSAEPGSTPTTVDIIVDDDGLGIPPQYRQRIFDVFSRLNARERYEGTGIGLAIVARLVERLDGRIVAEDSPLGGARFRVTLSVSESPDRHTGDPG